MKHKHNNYHPASYSVQARKMGNTDFFYWRFYQENPEQALRCVAHDVRLNEENEYVTFLNNTVAYYVDGFSCSYRAPIIRRRAAKRFGRLVRKYSSYKKG